LVSSRENPVKVKKEECLYSEVESNGSLGTLVWGIPWKRQ